MEAFISLADTRIPANERRFSMTDTMISASDTSLVATTICVPVPERTLGAVPAGVFVTPIHQQRTVRRKLWLNKLTSRGSKPFLTMLNCLIERSLDETLNDGSSMLRARCAS